MAKHAGSQSTHKGERATECGIWLPCASTDFAPRWYLTDCHQCEAKMDTYARLSRAEILMVIVVRAVLSAFRPSQWSAP